MNDLPKVDWIEDKRFERDGLCVVVQKLPLRRARYSCFVGRPMEKGISKYLPIFSEGTGSITIKRVGAIISDLLYEAEEYILGELQYQEDNWIEQRQFHEGKSLNRDKKRTPVGLGGPNSGKTARKKENRRKRMADEQL